MDHRSYHRETMVLIDSIPRRGRRRRRQRKGDPGSGCRNVETSFADDSLSAVPDLSAACQSFRSFVDAVNAIRPLFTSTSTSSSKRGQRVAYLNQLSTAALSLLEVWDNLRLHQPEGDVRNETPHSHAISQSVLNHVLWHTDLTDAIAFECCTWWLQFAMDASTQRGNERIASLLPKDLDPLLMWNSGLARLALKDSTTTRSSKSMLSDWQKGIHLFETCGFSLDRRVDHGGVTSSTAVADPKSTVVLEDAANEAFPAGFLLSSLRRERSSIILITGPPGSGKTYGCNQFLCEIKEGGENQESVLAVRPDVPMDMLAGTIKKSGCRSFSLASYSERGMFRFGSNAILLLDDFDSVALNEPAGSSEAHAPSVLRTRISLKNIIDVIRKRVEEHCLSAGGTDGGNMLLLLAAKDSHGLNTTRFDQVLELSLPNDVERRRIVSDWFFPDTDANANTEQHQSREELLDVIVDCTRGRGRSEMMHYCREGVFALSRAKHTPPDEQSRLQILRQLFQATSAASAKNTLGGTDDINVQVMGPTELSKLLAGYTSTAGVNRRIRESWEKHAAWDQLQSAILTPLCNSQDICNLLYCSSLGEQRVKRDALAGVLLTGESGSGKSSMARYCAALASSRLPSVCLLEVNCVSLIHKELGESERSVRRTFDLARAAAPCILLLDGIEHIAPVRGRDDTTQGTMDRVLSTVLTEMDGIGGGVKTKRVAVIGITTDVTWIDPALCRPGRLERCVQL